jgi:CD63 antigen
MVSFILAVGQTALGCIIDTQKISVVDSEYNTNESVIFPSTIGNRTEDMGIEETHVYLDLVSIPIIGGGVIIILLNIFGCIGSISESKRLLIAYMIAVVLVTLVQISGLTLSILYKDKLKDSIKDVLELRLRYYKQHHSVANSWDFAMSNLNCCGVNGWNDFESLNKLPKYCCKDQLTQCNVNEHDDKIPGCLTKVYGDILENYRIDIVILSMEIFFNLSGIVAATLMLRKSFVGSKQFWEWTSKIGGFKRDSRL